ncbi:hypothetical protein RRSWK_00271 [Rhodopirellula sp. SWK7]|nr:hypothetical protein RRSWK_00271 [Rhodopirellula sp. SWK7]
MRDGQRGLKRGFTCVVRNLSNRADVFPEESGETTQEPWAKCQRVAS